MSAFFLHKATWPISEDCRPKPLRKVVTQTDLDRKMLLRFPNLVEELNLCIAYRWRGEGKPGSGWDDWQHDLVPLDLAVEMSCWGEA